MTEEEFRNGTTAANQNEETPSPQPETASANASADAKSEPSSETEAATDTASAAPSTVTLSDEPQADAPKPVVSGPVQDLIDAGARLRNAVAVINDDIDGAKHNQIAAIESEIAARVQMIVELVA